MCGLKSSTFKTST